MRSQTFLLSAAVLLMLPLFLAAAPQLPSVEWVDGQPIRTVLPVDAIQALDEPPITSAKSAHFMHSDDPVIGVISDGVARAYPLRQLDWHEVVNDRLGEQPIAVTW